MFSNWSSSGRYTEPNAAQNQAPATGGRNATADSSYQAAASEKQQKGANTNAQQQEVTVQGETNQVSGDLGDWEELEHPGTLCFFFVFLFCFFVWCVSVVCFMSIPLSQMH